MKNTLWDKRIPTLLGLILILFGIGITSYLAQSGVIFITRATPGDFPQNVRITNITDKSFTVSYKTSDEVTGASAYGTDTSLNQNAFDDRDQQSGSVNPYHMHQITIQNLTPQTVYYFSITSGSNTFLNNEVPFEVTSAPAHSLSPPNQPPLSGKLLLPDGAEVKEAIVYATSSNAAPISALVKKGSYILPLNSLRTNDLSSYSQLSDSSQISLLFIDANSQSNVIILASQINPVPTITLSKNYDFTISSEPLEQTPKASESASSLFPSFTASQKPTPSSKDPQIISPKKDEAFSDDQPLFRGVAPPNATIKISVHSEEEITAEVKADPRGNWTFRPTTPLSPGEHIISITAPDQFGILRTITHTFTVYAVGTQISGASLSPTPTPAVAQTISPTPTLAPTATPPAAAGPTTSPTITPSQRSVESPGSSTTTTIAITAFLITAIGLLLFLFNRGKISSL